MDWFGLTAPILQAPIGGAASLAMVTAVGKAGGIGSLAMTWTEKEAGLEMVRALDRARVPFFLNFVLRFGAERPLWYCGGAAPAVTFSWGIDARLIAAFKAARHRVGVQVGSVGGAREAIAAGSGAHRSASTPCPENSCLRCQQVSPLHRDAEHICSNGKFIRLIA